MIEETISPHDEDMNPTTQRTRTFVQCVVLTCLAAPACLSRPLASTEPSTKNTFLTELRSQSVDKIDLLLAIDNSASMKDKQEFLAKAVPELVERLVTPNCVTVADDGTVTTVGRSTTDASGEGVCEGNARAEFKPITDIHIGIVSSSLGTFGAVGANSVCESKANGDDHANLLARGTAANGQSVRTEASDFLAWFPDVEKNASKPSPAEPYRDRDDLSASFSALVRGTSDQGCGLEAQLESMYQFLIAPQPWDHIAISQDAKQRASYEGINQTVLRQRHDFLRPDSLVAVIMLTDEDDSAVDPLSVSGTGHFFMNANFPQPPGSGTPRVRANGTTTAARPTAACATDPGSSECTSCAFGGCAPDDTYYGPDDDDLNVRFHDMKRRFGVDPQYPISRYVRGLSAPAVPGRDAEHGGAGQYGGYDERAADCINPLFYGGTLPTGTEDLDALCKPTSGAPARDSSLVYFALVGGVPNELIGADRRNGANELSEEAWTTLLGKDPAKYRDGIDDGKDPRMVQSSAARAGRPLEDPTDGTDDPLNSAFRDYETHNGDLQYACTFPLPEPIPAGGEGDCDGSPLIPRDGPLCAPGAATTSRAQIRAKAYPTIREARLVHDLGAHGILGSLCPQVSTGEAAAAAYGYNPVVNEIVDRLRNSITTSCLPRALDRAVDGTVSCLMLEVMPEGLDCTSDGRDRGRTPVDSTIAAAFRKNEEIPAAQQICELKQDPNATSSDACRDGNGGWCYLDGAAAGRCAQQVVFNDAVLATAKGSRVYLQCISEYVAGEETNAL